MIVEGEERARQLLKSKEEELHKVRNILYFQMLVKLKLLSQLANALFEYETLDLAEVQKVIKGEPIRPVEEKLLEAIKQETDESQPNSASPVPEPSPPPIATVS